MFLANLFRNRMLARQINRLARDVALRCQPTIQAKVARRAATMTRHEARGYVRVRSAEAIHAEVDRLLTALGVDCAIRPQVIAAATAAVVELVTRELARSSTQAGLARRAA